MQNKKTIILGLIAIMLLTGVVWYTSENKSEITNQAASILGVSSENEKITEQDGDFILGDPLAPVTIIEYSSHLCGACSIFHETTLPLIIENYVKTGQVRIIQRLVSHPALTIAVLCGQEQGAFWEVNEYIFKNIETIQTVDDIKAVAGELGLNQESFDECFESDKYKDQIMKWFNQGEADGAESTPTFLINEEIIVGVQPYAIFENVIESQLNN